MTEIAFGGIALIIIIAAILMYRRVTGTFTPSQAPTDLPLEPATLSSAPPAADKPTTKLCPWCKAEIPADAIACMHCGRQASEGMMRATLLGQVGSSMLIIGLIILLGAVCALTGGFGLF